MAPREIISVGLRHVRRQSSRYKPLRPMFRYFGGKSRYAPKILRYVPEHDTWVEPFVGGGSVTLAKPPSEKEVIADVRPDLIRFYQHVKNGEPLRCGVKSAARLERAYKAPEAGRTVCDFLANQQGTWAGKAETPPSVTWSNTLLPHKLVEGYTDYHRRLVNTAILRSDFRNVMEQYDGKDTVFYLDPPYPLAKEHPDYEKKNYTKYGGEVPNPKELRDFLAKRKGFIIMSYADTPGTRRLWGKAPFQYKRLRLRRSLAGPAGGPKTRSELLVFNYDPDNVESWHGLERLEV